MYLVTGASGKVGGAVVEYLLSRGQQVRVYLRSAHKGQAFAALGAKVAVGTFENVDELAGALLGARAVFLMQPNDFGSQDFVEDGARRARGYLQALQAAGSPPMVGLSSIGAQHPRGNGPIRRESRFEKVFREYPRAAFVRPSYFLENWANVMDAVRGPGIVPTFLTPGRPIAMVSVRDIGTAIGKLLVHPEAPRMTELARPEDYTPEEVVLRFSEVVGRYPFTGSAA